MIIQINHSISLPIRDEITNVPDRVKELYPKEYLEPLKNILRSLEDRLVRYSFTGSTVCSKNKDNGDVDLIVHIEDKQKVIEALNSLDIIHEEGGYVNSIKTHFPIFPLPVNFIFLSEIHYQSWLFATEVMRDNFVWLTEKKDRIMVFESLVSIYNFYQNTVSL